MEKTIKIEVAGETSIQMTKSIDLVQYMDDNISDKELREYVKDRLHSDDMWEGNRLKHSNTENLLAMLAGRDDFLKELIFQVNARQALDKDALIAELNR